MQRPALLPAIALVVGVAAGVGLPTPPRVILVLLLLTGWGGAVAAYARCRDRPCLVAILTALASAGWAQASDAAARAERTPLRLWFEDEQRRRPARDVFAIVEGTLRADAASRPWGASLDVRVDHVRLGAAGSGVGSGTAIETVTSGGLRASVSGSLVSARVPEWRAGRRVRVPIALRRPQFFLNPRGTRDERLLAWRGTSLVGSVKSALLVEVLARGDRMEEAAGTVRHEVRARVRRSVGRWSRRSAGVITAILIGDRAGLDESLELRLQQAGTYHVIAISGGNVAIFVALAFGMLRAVRLRVEAATCGALLLVVAYAGLVGPQPSVSRATIMAVAYLVARVLDHRTDAMNALGVSVAGLAWISPLSIADPGFALTVGATLAILAGTRRFRDLQPSRRWLAAPAWLLMASLSAEIALFPVSAFAFSRVTAAGLLLNLAAVPLMTMAQAAGMTSLALSCLQGDLADAAGFAAHLGAWGLAGSARLVEVMPWLSYRLPPPAPLAMVVYYVALLAWLFAATTRAQTWWPQGAAVRGGRAGAAVAIVAALWMLVEPVSAFRLRLRWTPTLRVTFLDVGQGDATLVRFPGGRTLLVDAGGGTDGFDLGARVVVPAIWALGVRRLDVFAITHGDPDHIGGAPSVLRDLTPADVWDGVPVPPEERLRALRQSAEDAGAAWRTLQRGDQLRVGGVDLRVWHPPLPDWERQRVRNDDSLVLELRYQDVSIVLPGDIGGEVERTLAPEIEPARIRVLKAAHHGSGASTSWEWLEALRPAAVVFSSGRDNPYGHPVPEVVDRTARVGARTLRTDRDGAISLETDGRRVWFNTYSGDEIELSINK